MNDRYPYRIPRDLERLKAIRPENRAKFDLFQRRLFVAYQLRVGDWAVFRPGLVGEVQGGRVDVILEGDGFPVFGVNGLAVTVHDLLDPGQPGRADWLWFLMPGDSVEVEARDGTLRTTVKAVTGPLQAATYLVEGSRRHFYPCTVKLAA